MKISITVNYENKVTIDKQVRFVSKLTKYTLLGVLERKNIKFVEERNERVYEITDLTEIEQIMSCEEEDLILVWLKYDLLDILIWCYERGRFKYVPLSQINEFSFSKFANKRVVIEDHSVRFCVAFTEPKELCNMLLCNHIFVWDLNTCFDEDVKYKLSAKELLICSYLGKPVPVDVIESLKEKMAEEYYYSVKYFLNKNKEKYPLIFFVYPELLII